MRYSLIGQLALDLISAPASEAYADRIFSYCSVLTKGQNNWIDININRGDIHLLTAKCNIAGIDVCLSALRYPVGNILKLNSIVSVTLEYQQQCSALYKNTTKVRLFVVFCFVCLFSYCCVILIVCLVAKRRLLLQEVWKSLVIS